MANSAIFASADHLLEAGRDDALRRHIEKIELPPAIARRTSTNSSRVSEEFSAAARTPSCFSASHLIAHQAQSAAKRRCRRRRGTVPESGSTSDLPAPVGNSTTASPPPIDLIDHFRLPAAKGGIAIDPLQDGKRIAGTFNIEQGIGTALVLGHGIAFFRQSALQRRASYMTH